jgi:hypothetical protein
MTSSTLHIVVAIAVAIVVAIGSELMASCTRLTITSDKSRQCSYRRTSTVAKDRSLLIRNKVGPTQALIIPIVRPTASSELSTLLAALAGRTKMIVANSEPEPYLLCTCRFGLFEILAARRIPDSTNPTTVKVPPTIAIKDVM